MKQICTILIASLVFFGCTRERKTKIRPHKDVNAIECTENGFVGVYEGPEFIEGSDVAHQFSNTASKNVGDKLKELYKSGNYAKVDFSRIVMSTKGMGSGTITYKISIPFKSVDQKCDAYTSFDHVGGWDHEPEKAARIAQLQSVLLPGEQLDISDLMTTPEGLQEYWIQWRNMEAQVNCKGY